MIVITFADKFKCNSYYGMEVVLNFSKGLMTAVKDQISFITEE